MKSRADPAASVLDKIRQKLRDCSAVSEIRLAGSFQTGTADSRSDIDILVLHDSSSNAFDMATKAILALISPAPQFKCLKCDWYGIPRAFKAFNIPVGWEGIEHPIEIHLTHYPFISCSQYWEQLFSIEERNFQISLRQSAKKLLSYEQYETTKSLQLYEAAWRMLGAWTIHQDLGLVHPRLQLAQAITPQLSPAPISLNDGVAMWLKGEDRSKPGVCRPLVTHSFDVLEALKEKGISIAIPQEPEWATILHQIQLDQQS